MTFDPHQLRDDFPILRRTVASGQPLAYLDNAASTQRPQVVIDAMSDCYQNYYANVHRGIHTLSEESTAAYEAARVTTQHFLNARSSREIVFTAGTTAGINTVARSWGHANVGRGDVILVTIAEHHANIVPWHQLAEAVGCRVEFLPINQSGTIDDSVVAQALKTHRPKLFAFTATSNVLGTNFPAQSWTEMAHRSGAAVLVDAAQAAPHEVIDVQQWDADFVVFSGHKVCGPTGIGVLYAKLEHLEAMPAFLGGGGMIQTVTTEGFTATEPPEKFEAGTPPIAEAIGLAEALRYLQRVGLDNIRQHENALCQRADQALRQIEGVDVLGPMPDLKGGIVSFTMDRIHAHDIAQWLDTRGVAVRAGHHCAMPLHDVLGKTASARASFYLYNTVEEVDRFIEAVQEVRKKFASKGRRRRRPPVTNA
ncbi:SufS family cysteine desulfurase [Roseiconus nitratireducens]|uniref:cysteine desulfurase n=1 Tax=Roseiconus nitratireducens TaxID=2605748 RepID=A0A5M6DCL6_9BACT|nr:SufS family cysteine desulfurase [Roseiconus nitratireducens]KAA5545123.1 SufS family cysteine desulfurase [Roseiconus nitratireducens]